MFFTSYSRRDATRVEEIAEDLEHAGHAVWRDRHVVGGQRWWDEILDRLRHADAVLFMMSGTSVRSKWCRTEITYAAQLGIPILPVRIDDVAISLAPDPIGDLQVVDFRERTPDTVISLLKAITALSGRGGLFPPPIAPPEIPIEDLGPLRDRLRADDLGLLEQREILGELLHHADDVDQRETVALLADLLAGRADLAAGVRPELESLVQRLEHSGASADPRHAERVARRVDLIRSLVTHLTGGRFTPIVGYGVGDRLIGDRSDVAREWADSFEFPLEPFRREDLAGVAQFVSVMTNADTVRERLREQVLARLRSQFDEVEQAGDLATAMRMAWAASRRETRADAHVTLASLDCPIYVDASPWPLLGDALRDAGKAPEIEICRWRHDTWEWPTSVFEREPDYRPTVERPLVFHPFGALAVPESVVIAEDDYLDFMAAVSEDRSLVPAPVRRALADSALLLLGVDLEDWDMRVLLRAMVGQEGASRLHRYTHVAAQVDPTSVVASPERARAYLERYFGRYRHPAIDIYWGTVDDFVGDLADALGAAG